MALRDNAIVAYAETKVMKKSDRDVWTLMGEIIEALLDKSGYKKSEIDGLVMSGLTGTGGASMFWAQSTCDMLGLEVGFCEQVHTGGWPATCAGGRGGAGGGAPAPRAASKSASASRCTRAAARRSAGWRGPRLRSTPACARWRCACS